MGSVWSWKAGGGAAAGLWFLLKCPSPCHQSWWGGVSGESASVCGPIFCLGSQLGQAGGKQHGEFPGEG